MRACSTSARWTAQWLICFASACASDGILDPNELTGGAGSGVEVEPDGDGSGGSPSMDAGVGAAGSGAAGTGGAGGDSGSGGSGGDSGSAGSGAAGGNSGTGGAGGDSGSAGAAGGDSSSGGSGGDSGSAGAAGTDGAGGASGSAGSAGSGGSGNEPTGPTVTTNLFSALLGVSEEDVDAKLTLAVERVFGIGTGEPNLPVVNGGYRLYYELPQDPGQAFIWAADSADVRSEGMSYGMMIAVQMDLQLQFDRLWAFAQTYSQYATSSSLTAWRHYFRWKGTVNTGNASNWVVNYAAEEGPAPDGEEYFAAALYLAHRRWGSDGAVNYLAHANALADAMLNNPSVDTRTPVFRQDNDMVVFYPHGSSANFSDPSYHLPAFYELFALDGPDADRARWREIAEVSRQYLVTSAHVTTGLHPDYANFDGTPNRGDCCGGDHDNFRYDAWRVVMNMAVDYAWFSSDARMKTQVEKYHAFFSTRLGNNNVANALFTLDGNTASGGGSTALTATLAAGALASEHASRAELVDNLWNVPQQTGPYRYYQEMVYVLGLLSTGGRFAYDWPE